MKTIFDPSFKYTLSIDTDVRKTFARIRREQQVKKARESVSSANDTKLNVLPLGLLKNSEIGT